MSQPLVDDSYLAYLATARAADLTHIQATQVFYRLEAPFVPGPGEAPLPVFCLCPANLTEFSDAIASDLEMYCIRVRCSCVCEKGV